MGFDNCGIISPVAVSPVVPCGPAVGGIGCGGLGTTTGVILVLFILLVIVLRAMRHHI